MSLFTLAMSQFVRENVDLINDICSIIDANWNAFFKNLFYVLIGLNTESIYTNIDVVVISYQKISIRLEN